MTKLQERIKELEKKILSKGDSKKDMQELIEMLENPSKEIKDEILYTQYLIGKLQGLKEGAKLTKEEIIKVIEDFDYNKRYSVEEILFRIKQKETKQ